MKRIAVSLTLALTLVALVACGNDDTGDSNTPTPPTTETPSPTPTEAPETPTATPTPDGSTSIPVHPGGTRSGNEAVDKFLDAYESGDRDTLASLLLYRTIPCVPADEADYQVNCPEGVAKGTPIMAFVHSACHGGWLLENQRDQLAAGLVEKASDVYAIYDTPDDAEPPAHDVALILVDSKLGWAWIVWLSDDGAITDIAFGCGHSLSELINAFDVDTATPILAPTA